VIVVSGATRARLSSKRADAIDLGHPAPARYTQLAEIGRRQLDCGNLLLFPLFPAVLFAVGVARISAPKAGPSLFDAVFYRRLSSSPAAPARLRSVLPH
jgi:hypothetical protein